MLRFCFAKHRKTRQNIQQAYQKANCKFATKLNTTKNYAFFGPKEVKNISRNLPPQSGYSRATQLSENEFGLVSSLSVKILSRKSQKYAFLVFFFNCKYDTLEVNFLGGGGGGSFFRKPITKALNIEKINTFFFSKQTCLWQVYYRVPLLELKGLSNLVGTCLTDLGKIINIEEEK